MRHLPFIDRLAELTTSPAWDEVAAGFLLMRHLDMVLESGRSVSPEIQQMLEDHIARINNAALVSLLRAGIEQLTASPKDQPTGEFFAPFILYASWLEAVGAFDLSKDVRETVAVAGLT